MHELKGLLHKDSKGLSLHHNKWFRSLRDSEITIKDQLYSLIATENKRELVFETSVNGSGTNIRPSRS